MQCGKAAINDITIKEVSKEEMVNFIDEYSVGKNNQINTCIRIDPISQYKKEKAKSTLQTLVDYEIIPLATTHAVELYMKYLANANIKSH